MFRHILWIEDQSKELGLFRRPLAEADFVVDVANDVTEAISKLLHTDHLPKKCYHAVVFDILLPPGNDLAWVKCANKLRKDKPDQEPRLGLELLRSIFRHSSEDVPLDPPIVLDPKRLIVLTVVEDSAMKDQLMGYDIPEDHIVLKSAAKANILRVLVEKMKS